MDKPRTESKNASSGNPDMVDEAKAPAYGTPLRFTIDVGWVLAMDIAAMVLGFVVQPMLARTLGAGGLGLYTLCLTIAGFALLPSNLGLAHSLLCVAASATDGDEERRQVSVGLLTSAALGTIVAVVVLVTRARIAEVLNAPELSALLPILAMSFPFASVFVSVTGVLNGRRSMASYSLLGVGHRIMAAGFVLALLAAGCGVVGAVWGLVLTEVVLGVVSLPLLRYRIFLPVAAIQQRAAGLISFGARLAATNAANTIMTHVDIFMVGYFLTTADVGHYGVAILLASLVPRLPQAIQRVVFPAAAKCWAVKDMVSLRVLVWKTMQLSAAAVTLLGIGLAFFGANIITVLFGGDFAPAIAPFLILLLARVVRGGTVVATAVVLAAMGRPDINLKVETTAVVVNIGLNMLLIPRMGLPGAALATTISLLVATSMTIVAMVRLVGVDMHIGWYARLWGMATFTVVAYVFLRAYVQESLLAMVLLIVAASFTVGVLLSGEDRAWLRSVCASLFRRSSPPSS